MKTTTVTFKDGIAIYGTFPNVWAEIAKHVGVQIPLTIADPPYGNIVNEEWDTIKVSDKDYSEQMIQWTRSIADLSCIGSALYVWGGVGTPKFRPFLRYLVQVEHDTPYTLSTPITWKKKRAYGIQWGYLFTREEVAYLIKGDHKEPRTFNIPLLDTKRGYAGYNAKYPAKSEYLRRSNVWDDVTEIMRGKTHINQKPRRLCEIPIEVHTNEGEWVLDPFAGSGTTAHAARHLNRRFVVVEQDKNNFERMVASLRGEHVSPLNESHV